MTTLSVIFGIFYLGSYKSYGKEHIKNESFLTLVASVSSFFGVFRFGWSLMMMRWNFKKTYAVMISLQIIIAFVLPFVMESGMSSGIKKFTYTATICMI